MNGEEQLLESEMSLPSTSAGEESSNTTEPASQEEPKGRERNLTEKGIQERLSSLKRNKSSALSNVTKKRTELAKLMSEF